jgi:hypothetical protein
MAVPGVDTSTGWWAAHRRRAEALRAYHAFAGEVLTLYLALLDVWTAAGDAAREQAPEPQALAAWAGEHVLPRVVGATVEAGPELLADATRKLVELAPRRRCRRGSPAPATTSSRPSASWHAPRCGRRSRRSRRAPAPAPGTHRREVAGAARAVAGRRSSASAPTPETSS